MSPRLSLLALAVSAGPVAAQGLISPGPSQPGRSAFYDPVGPRPVYVPSTMPAALLGPGGGAAGFMAINRPVLYHPISTPPYVGYPYSYSYLGTTSWYYGPPAAGTYVGLAPQYAPGYGAGTGGPSGVRVAGSGLAASTGGVTVDLPAAAELWVNGVKQSGEQQSWSVTVPTAGGQTAVLLAAKWTAGGVTYDWNRTLTVFPGDHGRLMVVSGTAATAAPAPRAK